MGLRVEDFSGRSLLEVRELRVLGERAAGQFLLRFEFKRELGALDEKDRYELSEMRLQVWTSVGNLFLGYAQYDYEPRAIVARNGSSQFLFRLPIAGATLKALETQRAGGDCIHLNLRWTGMLLAADGQSRTFASDGDFRIERQQWVEALNATGFSDVSFLEIPRRWLLESDRADWPDQAIESAYAHLANGRYDAAVTECRKALEAVSKAANDQSDATKARKALGSSPNDRKAMSHHERSMAIRESVYHLANLGPHHDGRAFTQAEARMVLTLTLGLLEIEWRREFPEA